MINPNITEDGKFKSSKHPDLPVDRVRLNVARKENWPGLLMIANAYQDTDPDFANALRRRVVNVAKEQHCTLIHIHTYVGIQQGELR